MRLRALPTVLIAATVLTGCASSSDELTGSGAAAAELRTVAHAMGETEVPADPQRVVVLDTPHLDSALSLDVTPVGSVQSDLEGLPDYVADRAEGIEIVGTIEEPDLEAVAALKPDLILSSKVRHEEIYDRLSQIAPTVFTDYEKGWKDIFTVTADALDKTEEGEQALTDYTERAEKVGEQIGTEGMKASMVRFLPDETRIYGPGTFSGSILTDVGFELPQLKFDEYSMAYISPEQIELADADVLFATSYGDAAATTKGAVTALWNNLDAVSSGCQFFVEDDEWMLAIGPIGAGIVLDQIESSLAGKDCG
jgi:iron complex transport system substrate-binding protein